MCRKIYSVIALIFLGSLLVVQGQEICGNNIDDDGDGKVDEAAPGGIHPYMLAWFKANEGFGDAGWTDQSSSGKNAAITGNPTLVENSLNFNPGVRFDGDDFLDFYMPEVKFENGNNHVMVSVVYKPAYTGAGSAYGVMGNQAPGSKYNITLADGAVGNGGSAMDIADVFSNGYHLVSMYLDEEGNAASLATGHASGVYRNGSNIQSFTYDENGAASINDNYYIGKSGTHVDSKAFTGDFHELMFYHSTDGNITMNHTQREQIESYLGIKYGIHLNHNFYDSNGDIIWNKATNSAYHNMVTGIGKDPCSGLVQLESKNSNRDAILIVQGSEDYITDGEFLLWGTNGQNYGTYNNLGVPQGIKGRIPREWKFEEVGETGPVWLQFKLDDLGTVEVDDLRLLIDTDGDGDYSDEREDKGGVLSGAVYRASGVYGFANINVTPGMKMTLGTVDRNQTPLPVELLSFDARPFNNEVLIEWSTASEINNDYFSIERSQDGEIWKSIANVKGAGNSNDVILYREVDESPFTGTSYYRLLQVDYDGTKNYSEMVAVEINGVSISSILPNPNDGTFQVEIMSTDDDAEVIETVRNQMGTVVYQSTRILSLGRNVIEKHFNSLPRGSYMITLDSKDGKVREMQRFIIL